MKSIQQIFSGFEAIKVGVIGDMMLDTYMWGSVDRISPEAPVPIVSLQSREQRIGGAGNVALNCRSAGAKVFVLGTLGGDEEGRTLTDLFRQRGIGTEYLLYSDKRLTTNKTRIISRNQQMMRLDAEVTEDLLPAEENGLLEAVRKFIATEQPQVIIFEDYNKGILTPRVIEETIRLCKAAGIITTVDPKRKNFFCYKGVDIFKPNLKEVKEALNLLTDGVNLELLNQVHKELHDRLSHHISLITLSEKGVFYQNGDKGELIPSHFRNIADVSGAGDTVIAIASLVYAVTREERLAAAISNIAGGIVCEEVGTVPVQKDRLLKECSLLLS